MRQLSDFLFLGSSSLIVAGGDAPDNKSVNLHCTLPHRCEYFSFVCRNLIIWDTLLPNKRNVVKGAINTLARTHTHTCASVHTCIHARMHTHIHQYTRAHTNSHNIFTHSLTHLDAHECTDAHIIHTHTCVSAHGCTHTLTCSLCTHAPSLTHPPTHSRAHTHTHTHAHTHTHRVHVSRGGWSLSVGLLSAQAETVQCRQERRGLHIRRQTERTDSVSAGSHVGHNLSGGERCGGVSGDGVH